ncbi:MAG TPA: cyclophilin-like fold protein [Methylophilaceae bacterium]|nr:cyclophilin-like fold protein [Methylophilaceae bacterium]
MKINIAVGDKTIQATLLNNPTAQDFISKLPLTLKLEDYNSTEKISDLPKKLTKKDAPGSMNPSRGDIAYYAPWGNLAIFYRDFSVSPGLIKLGVIDSGLETLEVAGAINVTISVAKPQSLTK